MVQTQTHHAGRQAHDQAGAAGGPVESQIHDQADGQAEVTRSSSPYRRSIMFWLNLFFLSARHAPALVRWTRPFWMMLSRHWFVGPLRGGLRRNARWLLDPEADEASRAALVDAVLENFYMFIHDVGRAGRLSPHELQEQIETVAGHEHFVAAREAGRGAIVATAHMGSFEVGIAAVRSLESRVHVAFQHDNLGSFDRIRHRLHQKLGVIEAPVDEGWGVWLGLRDALLNDEVVLMQTDRTMPGQRGVAVPFCGGHVLLPLGPVKLAAMTGAPIVPVFAPRTPEGKVRIVIEPAIHVDPEADDWRDGEAPPALVRLAGTIERHVKAHPEQWLMLHPAWLEDTDPRFMATEAAGPG